MRLNTIGLITVSSVLLMTAKPVAAHHSFDAEYDSKKTTTISGYVTKLDWVNPHAFVFIDTKDESGAVKNFKVEMGPPYALVRGGWKRDTVKIGDKVTVQAAALAKDESGAVRSYKIEMGPPYALVRGGWKRDTIKIGDKVTVNGAARAKDGSDAAGSMQTTSMTLATGQKLVMR